MAGGEVRRISHGGLRQRDLSGPSPNRIIRRPCNHTKVKVAVAGLEHIPGTWDEVHDDPCASGLCLSLKQQPGRLHSCLGGAEDGYTAAVLDRIGGQGGIYPKDRSSSVRRCRFGCRSQG